MKIAVVGIGYWGKNLLRNFNTVADVVRVCHEGDPDNRRWVESRYPDVEVSESLDATLANAEIDAVAIATPARTHYEITKRSLEADKHVFVEKPVATTPEQAEDLRHLADRLNRILFVGYIFVHHPLMRDLRSILADKRVKALRFNWAKLGSFHEDIFLDLLPHPVSVHQSLLDERPREVHCDSGQGMLSAADALWMRLSHSSAVAEVLIDRCTPIEDLSLVVRTDDVVYAWTDTSLYRLHGGKGRSELIGERTEEPLKTECKKFVDSVKGSAAPVTDGAFAVDVAETISRAQ